MILIAPILVITSGALTARLTGMALFGRFQSAIGGGVPYLIIIVIFTLMYRFMPHTKVTFKAAAFSGLLAGTLFQLSEWLYLACQANVSRYNAVYGAFAALPLFLAWLQIGWLVILLGAEISFAIDNEETYALEKDWARASLRFRRLLALRFVEKIAKRFERGGTPLSAADLSHELAVPVRLARMVLYELVSAAVLIEFTLDTSPEGRYQPARPLADLTIKNVLDALDHAGEEPNIRVRDADLDAIIKRMRNFDELVASSPDNAPVHRLREET
jgi:membrane protein